MIVLDAFLLVNPTFLPTLDLRVNTTDHSSPCGPTPEDESERLALVANRESRDEATAEYWLGVRELTMAEHYDRWDSVSDDELIECRGHHPYLAHDI